MSSEEKPPPDERGRDAERPGAKGGVATGIRVLANPYAGGAPRARPDTLARELAAAGVSATIEAVEPEGLARRVRDLSHGLVVGVAGGDGSQRTAARALLGTHTILAPIPTGRLNHFARRLGLDSVGTAAEAIRRGRCRTISVGRIDEDVFLNTAVVGTYVDFVRLRERLRPVLTTWPAAAVAALITLARWPRLTLTLRTPDLHTEVRTGVLWVGLGRDSFPEPHEAPLPSADDGLEAVVLTGGRRAALGLAWTLLHHRLRRRRPRIEPPASVIHARWIELEAGHRIPIALDGEPRSVASPVRLAFEPRALRVVVPHL